MQEHNHSIEWVAYWGTDVAGAWNDGDVLYPIRYTGSIGMRIPKGFPSVTGIEGSGATTRGKSKGVTYIIKVL